MLTFGAVKYLYAPTPLNWKHIHHIFKLTFTVNIHSFEKYYSKYEFFFTMIPCPKSYGTVKSINQSINQSIILIIQNYLNVLQENIILVYTFSQVIQRVVNK